jgi:predicted  nucleic acid-binding Zn-ribbon protein
MATQAGAEMNLSKLYYRRAQAREQLRRPQEAAGDMRRSYEEAQRAVDTEVARIRQCGSALARRQPLAQQSVKSLQAELPRLEQQLNRCVVFSRKTRPKPDETPSST